MKTYLVHTIYPPPTGSAEQVENTNERSLFQQLRALSEKMPDKLIVVNELRITGVAIVKATDEGALALDQFGYIVKENEVWKLP